nr:MAG TPA: hypothetical protein [Bacteriophage sp.]
MRYLYPFCKVLFVPYKSYHTTHFCSCQPLF